MLKLLKQNYIIGRNPFLCRAGFIDDEIEIKAGSFYVAIPFYVGQVSSWINYRESDKYQAFIENCRNPFLCRAGFISSKL